MKDKSLKIVGSLLVTLGVLAVILKIVGLLPFLGGGLFVGVALGFPTLGGFLLFVARSLSRPAGVDNDQVYQNSSTSRGAIGIALAVVLTGFYIMIYLGDDITLSENVQATVQVDDAGKILGVSGPGTALLNKTCWQCPNKKDASNWWKDAEYKTILPYSGAYQALLNNGENVSNESTPGITVNDIFVFQISNPAPGTLQFSIKDTLHHYATRNIYSLLSPISRLISGKPADNWFFYGTLYTLAILVFGVRMILKYRHNTYHIIRTISVMFFQLGFGYMIPNILVLFKQPGYYFSYFWPLKPEYFYPSTWATYAADVNSLGIYFVIFGALMSFVAVPVLTFFYGKRWYCSWVCGCGGLAETLGDPFRQLSDKSLKAWQTERWLIHSVLVLITAITVLLWANSFSAGKILGSYSESLTKGYGLFIGQIFSGVVGVGFYPLFGSRVWCRFGCPMAAILGMGQKFFSRFRITTNGGQCISCGNCSTYCEMGIDVRWYAQRGQNIIRSSCVGCGVCAAVCPRGVLRLENGSLDSIFTRYNDPAATVLN